MKNIGKKYRKMAIESASRERLLLMFYEEAIKCIKTALVALEENQIEKKCKNIARAYDIVLELSNTLDHKIGGQIAIDLDQLYMFIMDSLIQVNLHEKKELLEEVLKILTTLYNGWMKAVQKVKKEEELKKEGEQKAQLSFLSPKGQE